MNVIHHPLHPLHPRHDGPLALRVQQDASAVEQRFRPAIGDVLDSHPPGSTSGFEEKSTEEVDRLFFPKMVVKRLPKKEGKQGVGRAFQSHRGFQNSAFMGVRGWGGVAGVFFSGFKKVLHGTSNPEGSFAKLLVCGV